VKSTRRWGVKGRAPPVLRILSCPPSPCSRAPVDPPLDPPVPGGPPPPGPGRTPALPSSSRAERGRAPRSRGIFPLRGSAPELSRRTQRTPRRGPSLRSWRSLREVLLRWTCDMPSGFRSSPDTPVMPGEIPPLARSAPPVGMRGEKGAPGRDGRARDRVRDGDRAGDSVRAGDRVGVCDRDRARVGDGDPDRDPAPVPGPYQPRTQAKTRGATMVASDSMMNFGVSTSSLPQVIFSLGTAPE